MRSAVLGATMAKRHYDDAYSNELMRRTKEMEEAGMIQNDNSAIANMPQGVKIQAYSKSGSYMPEDLDDTIKGVDKQIDMDDNKRNSHFKPKKV